MAAWSTAMPFGAGRRLRVGGHEIQPGLRGVERGKRLHQPQDREDADLVGGVGVGRRAMSSGQQSMTPARSPSSVRCVGEQLLIWSARRGSTA